MPSKLANIKKNLHPLNKHNSGYDFDFLVTKHTLLARFLINVQQSTRIDFADYDAVVALNTALLKAYYRIDHWQIPKGYLCPAIPGRVDYIHYLAQLLDTEFNHARQSGCTKTLQHAGLEVLDIGTGASCIYPILGQRCYQWRFTASDIDPVSVTCAKELVAVNKGLSKKISIVLQKNTGCFFKGVIKNGHRFTLSLCNPPFHASLEKALSGNSRKRANLAKSNGLARPLENKTALNFGGQQAELFCSGGELTFITKMMLESVEYKNQVLFFSCLVSKSAHLKTLQSCLSKLNADYVKVIKMSQGQKISHFIAWSFLDATQRAAWFKL